MKVSDNESRRYELFGCDTMVSLPSSSADGQTLFAKNSDRQISKAHIVCNHCKKTHSLMLLLLNSTGRDSFFIIGLGKMYPK